MERTFEQQQKTYRIIYALVRPLAALIYPIRVIGRENIPEGAAVICANHSNYIDPVLMAFAFGWDKFIHFMAKKELRSVPILGKILEDGGVVFVERGKNDIDAIRASMRILKAGRQVLMFPEGTRVGEDNAVDAKTGSVRIAAKLHAPIVPVYLPRRKYIFGKITITIGKPYYVEASSHEEYLLRSEEVMEKIYALRDGVGA
ncbi:MAG: lysophospholipid acyltransferase family protein [Oscillospiraceae bacterium]